MECELSVGRKMGIDAVGKGILRNLSYARQTVLFTSSYYDMNEAVSCVIDAVKKAMKTFEGKFRFYRRSRSNGWFFIRSDNGQSTRVKVALSTNGIKPVCDEDVLHIWKTDRMGTVPLGEFVQLCNVGKFCLYHGVESIGIYEMSFFDKIKAFHYPEGIKRGEVEGDSLICEQCGKCKMDRLVNAELSSEIGLYCFESKSVGSIFRNGWTMGVVTENKCARMIRNGVSRTLFVNKECPLYMEHMIGGMNR